MKFSLLNGALYEHDCGKSTLLCYPPNKCNTLAKAVAWWQEDVEAPCDIDYETQELNYLKGDY